MIPPYMLVHLFDSNSYRSVSLFKAIAKINKQKIIAITIESALKMRIDTKNKAKKKKNNN